MDRAKELASAPVVPLPSELAPDAPSGRGLSKYWPAVQVEQHMQAVESLYLSTISKTAICRTMRTRFGISESRANQLLNRVKERWLAEDAEARPVNKSAQIRRLLGYIRDARGERDQDGTWKVKPDTGALAKFEMILADIQGTKAPVEIAVDVRIGHAMQNVIAGLSSDQMTRYLAEAREQRALAQKARELMSRNVIDVKVEQ